MDVVATARKWYQAGRWSKADLERLVKAGKLTQEQFESIVAEVDGEPGD